MKSKRLEKSFNATVLSLFSLARVKRVVALGVLLGLFQLGAVGLEQKAKRLTLNMKNVVVDDVLGRIEALTDYSFLFSSEVIDVSKKVSVSCTNATIQECLDQLLKSFDVQYLVDNKQIILSKRLVHLQPQSIKKAVKGLVTDSNGEPIVGATVVVQDDLSTGTITDVNGEFSLNVVSTPTPTLMVSFIGMEQALIAADFSKHMLVVLNEENEKLQEVVVTALGIKRKSKSLTYATQNMDKEELMRVQDANFINSLQGKTAGLTITANAGGAGGASKILLRGNKSILGNNTPLIVVDGIPMSNSVKNQQGVGGGSGMGYGFSTEGSDALSSINPDDIESISILKGANAAALYGSAASNGVIMITTKTGKEGVMTVSVTSNATFETPFVLPELQDQYGALVNTNVDPAQISAHSWGGKISDMTDEEVALEGLTNRPQDYIKDFFNTGATFNNSVSLSSGTKTGTSYFSVANTTSNGMVENNRFSRNTVAFRQNYNLFDDVLRIDVSMNYVNQMTKQAWWRY